MSSKFGEWFRAQHGPRPGGIATDEALLAEVRKGQIAEAILKRRERWDDRFQSALYAWQVDDEGKRGDAA